MAVKEKPKTNAQSLHEMMAEMSRAATRATPELSKEPSPCWLWHQWSKWTPYLSAYQRRQCLRCGKIKERYI